MVRFQPKRIPQRFSAFISSALGLATSLPLPLILLLTSSGLPGMAQQAGTIGSSTSTTVSRQLVTTESTTTTNNLSQSLIITASGVSASGGGGNLIQSNLQNYTLATPNGSVPILLRTTEINPSVSFAPLATGADLQLSITHELPGIKSVTVTGSTSDVQSTTNNFSVYTAPLSQ
jgi:hypothetical protein